MRGSVRTGEAGAFCRKQVSLQQTMPGTPMLLFLLLTVIYSTLSNVTMIYKIISIGPEQLGDERILL